MDARVTLVEVDELHNLNTATRAGAEASDTLKYFTERIPATFLYAGISLDRAGLLSGTRGEQIAGWFGISRYPSARAMSSLRPSARTPIITSRHSLCSSSRMFTWIPSAHR